MRKTPSWPRSWAIFSLLELYSHRNAWANLHLLGQPNSFLAQDGAAFGTAEGHFDRASWTFAEHRRRHAARLRVYTAAARASCASARYDALVAVTMLRAPMYMRTAGNGPTLERGGSAIFADPDPDAMDMSD